ncbi:unnamed protein product [Didymodactylos carnosus]|uniref:Uncharacterized protein n=1 Tax=Didymodactylos carnosus TaxID=1234261 RepID=A0A814I715_9BILA|nr:unnamed protein product [Didymodactylos carnosus]CAF1160458.1 unnamed protein product [Didymodactylos carnosus]CAF3789408.1 unnamed protein product [Didymodactylos carnosus]CAF3972138.1 unnamed protein product [Didymodactylos carnosus]
MCNSTRLEGWVRVQISTSWKSSSNPGDISSYLTTRRQPRRYRQVIRLPDPEPIYRTIRRRMPTPERQIVNKTIYQKQNGDIVERVQAPRKKTKDNRFNQNSD